MARFAVLPDRFGGVGAWHARRNSAVFLRSRDRGCEDAVFFRKSEAMDIFTLRDNLKPSLRLAIKYRHSTVP